MKKITLFIFTTIFINLLSFGQLGTDIFTLGTDDADNYGAGWNTTNQGSGFSDWTFDSSDPIGIVGRFIGSFSSAIDVNGKSFGIYGNNAVNAFYGASLDFPKSLQEGDSFKVTVGVNVTDESKGFDLRNSSFTPLVNFNVGAGTYTLGGTLLFSGINDPNTVITFTFTQNANTLSWTAVRSGGLTGSESGTINFINAGSITNIRFYNSTPGGSDGAGRDLFFNSLEFTSKYTINNSSSVTATTDQTIPYLDIQSGSTLTINTGIGVTVSGNLNNSGSLVLNSSSSSYSSVIPSTFSGSGTNQYNRYTNIEGSGTTGGNDLVSPPVSGQNFNLFDAANTNLSANGTDRAFAPFDNSLNPGDYVNYTASTTTALLAGKGYRAATSDGSNLTYQGTLNTGDVNIFINQYTGTYGAWNLVGNPYPSYIRLGDFLSENNNQFDASFAGVYGYDGTASDGWTIWDSNSDQDLLIAPGQGFFVASQSGGGNCDFTTTMRRTGTSDDFISGRTTNGNFARAKLTLSDTDNTYATNLYFRDINTKGLDPGYDTGAHFGEASGIFTQLVANNAGVELVNQSLPFADIGDVVVPLGVKSPSGEQISIALDPDYDLPASINVYLEDNVANTWTLLNTNDYVFTPTTDLNGTGRLFAHFTTSILSTEESILTGLQIFSDNASRSIVIKGQLNAGTHATIYDLQGRQVIKQALNSAVSNNVIIVNGLSTGLYIVELSDFNKKRSQKVIIK